MHVLTETLMVKDWMPVIGAAVVLLIFIIHRVIDHLNKKKEIARNWYMKVLLEPQIKVIHEFFDSVIKEYELASQQIKTDAMANGPNKQQVQVIIYGKFQELKRQFEGSLILPIDMTYHEVAEKLTDILLDLEDTFTGRIDNNLFSDDDISDFIGYTLSFKANLLRVLYAPVA